MENGLALKKDSIKVCIHSIEVTIRPQSISDEKQNYNEETKLYTYSIYSGMLIDFEEHELEAFLHDNRKIMEISANPVFISLCKDWLCSLYRKPTSHTHYRLNFLQSIVNTGAAGIPS